MFLKKERFPPFSPQRRLFLLGVGASCLATAGGWGGYRLWYAYTMPTNEELIQRILAVTPGGPKINALAEQLQTLKTMPAAAAETLAQITQGWPDDAKRTDESVKTQLDKQIAQDFAAGKMQEIDGWFYAETELRVTWLHGIIR